MSPLRAARARRPNYLNSNKTIFQGRRIAKDASCIDPIVAEMSEVCQVLKLRHVIEPYKCYPRDFTYSGRIKVGGAAVRDRRGRGGGG